MGCVPILLLSRARDEAKACWQTASYHVLVALWNVEDGTGSRGEEPFVAVAYEEVRVDS